jgi:hypothetical protein
MTMLASVSMVQQVCSTVLQHGSNRAGSAMAVCVPAVSGVQRNKKVKPALILQHGPVPTARDVVPSTPFVQAHQ